MDHTIYCTQKIHSFEQFKNQHFHELSIFAMFFFTIYLAGRFNSFVVQASLGLHPAPEARHSVRFVDRTVECWPRPRCPLAAAVVRFDMF